MGPSGVLMGTTSPRDGVTVEVEDDLEEDGRLSEKMRDEATGVGALSSTV